mmetsp:Transcript_26334/g.57458  ORF Transcript_26334/g.57458 Transcript_26334/m.57458 type:complete len:716 (-) Transcript_26334:746-2893(-)
MSRLTLDAVIQSRDLSRRVREQYEGTVGCFDSCTPCQPLVVDKADVFRALDDLRKRQYDTLLEAALSQLPPGPSGQTGDCTEPPSGSPTRSETQAADEVPLTEQMGMATMRPGQLSTLGLGQALQGSSDIGASSSAGGGGGGGSSNGGAGNQDTLPGGTSQFDRSDTGAVASPTTAGGMGLGAASVEGPSPELASLSLCHRQLLHPEHREGLPSKQHWDATLRAMQELPAEYWARMGPSRDTLQRQQFEARSYHIKSAWDPVSNEIKVTARPDTFRIDEQEAARREDLYMQHAAHLQQLAAEASVAAARRPLSAPSTLPTWQQQQQQQQGLGGQRRHTSAAQARPYKSRSSPGAQALSTHQASGTDEELEVIIEDDSAEVDPGFTLAGYLPARSSRSRSNPAKSNKIMRPATAGGEKPAAMGAAAPARGARSSAGNGGRSARPTSAVWSAPPSSDRPPSSVVWSASVSLSSAGQFNAQYAALGGRANSAQQYGGDLSERKEYRRPGSAFKLNLGLQPHRSSTGQGQGGGEAAAAAAAPGSGAARGARAAAAAGASFSFGRVGQHTGTLDTSIETPKMGSAASAGIASPRQVSSTSPPASPALSRRTRPHSAAATATLSGTSRLFEPTSSFLSKCQPGSAVLKHRAGAAGQDSSRPGSGGPQDPLRLVVVERLPPKEEYPGEQAASPPPAPEGRTKAVIPPTMLNTMLSVYERMYE